VGKIDSVIWCARGSGLRNFYMMGYPRTGTVSGSGRSAVLLSVGVFVGVGSVIRGTRVQGVRIFDIVAYSSARDHIIFCSLSWWIPGYDTVSVFPLLMSPQARTCHFFHYLGLYP